MSEDLISRSALMEEIESLRVTVTGLRAGKGILREFMEQYKASVLKIIDEAPTAYDVDKVVEQLKANSKTMMQVIPAGIAIEIVKAGGAE